MLPEATLEEFNKAQALSHDAFVEFVETHSMSAIWDQLDPVEFDFLPTRLQHKPRYISRVSQGWHGVDLDGTLAEYDHWRGLEHIGAPIPAMARRVSAWLANHEEVRIVTARFGDPQWTQQGREPYAYWCLKNFGRVLPITDRKDYAMIDLWDDRAVQVEKNTGVALVEEAQRQRDEWEARYETLLGSVGGVSPG